MQSVEERAKARRKSRDVRIYTARIQHSINENEAYMSEFQRNLDFYVGQQEQGEMASDMRGVPYIANEDQIVVNRLLPALRSTNSSIMFKVPWFTLQARKMVTEQEQAQMDAGEHALNYVLNTPANVFLHASRLAVLGAELGIGGLKTTYTPFEGYEPKDENKPQYGRMTMTVDPETGQEMLDIEGGKPKIGPDGNLIVRQGNKVLLETRDVAKEYRVDFVDFRDCVFDPEGTNDFRDHRWFAQRKSWTWEEFRDNKRLTNKDGILQVARYLDESSVNEFSAPSRKRRLERGRNQFGRNLYRPTTATQRDMMRIWGYQVWDFEKQVVVYLVDNYDKLVGVDTIPGYIDHSPYSWLKFNEVLSEWMPYPDVTAARPLCRAYNRAVAQRLTLQGGVNAKFETKKGEIDQTNREELKHGEAWTIIESKSGQALRPIEPPQADSQIFADMSQYVNDFSEIMSNSPEARGAAASDTATQAAIISNRGTLGEEDKRRLVAICLGEIATKTYNCLQATMDTSMAVSIAGPTGQRWNRVVSPQEIKADAEATVNVLDLRPHDEAKEISDSAQMLQILGPAMFLSEKLAKWFFEARRIDDPQIVAEAQKVGFLLATGGLGQGGGSTSAKGGGGGPKPPDADADEQGATFEGRSMGRELREEPAVSGVP